MKTEKISSISFESKVPKQRFITDNMRASITSLLLRMNAETTVETKGDHFVSTITNRLKSTDGHVFEDERRYKKRVPYKEQMKGFSVLKFGKTRFDIDNESGEIIDYKKPFYKPWFVVLKKAEEVLNNFRGHFYDHDTITRNRMELQELTPDGEKQVKRMVLEYEKRRLKEVTAKLEKEV